MKGSLRAFISYRHGDAFMHVGQGVEPVFIAKLKDALTQFGFTQIFVDSDAKWGMHAGDHYRIRVYREIENCDLFIALIGKKWLDILNEKIKADEQPDMLVREIRTALKREKEIVPLLIDGTVMPNPSDLPAEIREFHYAQGIPVQSSDSVETIAALLASVSQQVARARKLGFEWRMAYLSFSVLAYYFCAIHTHIVGVMEYGFEPWLGMAKVWSGFYVWPIVFLPFSLVALYRPVTVVLEFATNSTSIKDAAIYASPLTIGLMVAVLAVAFEVGGKYEVPWTIHPLLPQPGCQRGPVTAPPLLAKLSSYDRNDALKKKYVQMSPNGRAPFWLEDKCWPNVFFYLTMPVYQGLADANYSDERPEVQRSFMAALEGNQQYSKSFIPYVISFSILIWLGSTGVILTVFYVAVRIHRPQDGILLKIPSEDAYLCLTYAFLTLMVWVPFRMNTIYFKNLYSCSHLPCTPSAEHYLQDGVLGAMLLIGYLYLTVGLLVRYRRLALTVLGAAAAILIMLCAVAVVRYSETIAALAEQWQFYVGISIPMITILAALWFQFSPKYIRRADDREENA